MQLETQLALSVGIPTIWVMASGIVASARGRSMVRPWRVGLLVDTSSRTEVREAIAKLCSVWGGRFMPILDRNAPVEGLRRQGQLFDVDALYAEEPEGPLADLLREPGWAWPGRGDWGPFAQHSRFRKGVLPIAALLAPGADFVQPLWDNGDGQDLAYAAIWGLSDRIGIELSRTVDGRGPRLVPLPDALVEQGLPGRVVGAADLTCLHVRAQPRRFMDGYSGFAVLRPDNIDDSLRFWNLRSKGVDLVGLPADASDDVVRLIARNAMLTFSQPVDDEQPGPRTDVTVWGLEHASPRVRTELEGTASKLGLAVGAGRSASLVPWVFQGVETPFTAAVRVEFRPGEHWIDIPIARLPLVDDPSTFSHGVVAAEVDLHRVSGQDPRFTSSLPPFRRHSDLLKPALAWSHTDQGRVSVAGQVAGVDASREHAPYSFVLNLDVLHRLFDDDAVKISQSDVGRFQTRAAEKFGGPFSGLLNQPGVRSAVLLAAGERDGVPLPHLREVVERDRGGWPGPFPSVSPKDYAEQKVNVLLHSGLFVPVLKVHCSHCRVERWASADELSSTMVCEFCGESFLLALSHALVRPKWHYRLAAHLPPKQVQALLPAMAVTSLIGQFRHVEEPPLAHVLGLEVEFPDRKLELDVAIYVPDHDWLLVIGEVKGGNRIDSNDVENLELVATRLSKKDVRCLELFATLKGHLTEEEITILRRRVERSTMISTTRGNGLPNMPLVLTGPDLSQTFDAEDHPWRWDSKNYSGLHGTAVTSCERNLGLIRYSVRSDGSIDCVWGDSPTATS